MGLIEGVGRTRYRDDVDNRNAFPLDDKIGLQIIGENRSRYTSVFAQNAALLYAELTEESAVETLNQLLFIDIEKASLSQIGQAVSLRYALPPIEAEPYSDLLAQAKAAMHEAGESCESGNREGFLAQRLDSLDADPDRDSIIKAAINGSLEGVESGKPTKSVLYVLTDGTGVPGLAKELSPEGKNGDNAKTFEAKIGCSFRQEFSEEGLPVLKNGDIERVPDTTKYIGTTGKIDIFRPLFANFLALQGFLNACQIVFLGDGAPWIWKLQQLLCPNAICIIDFFHATENLNKIVDMLRINGSKREAFRRECHHLLELGEVALLGSRIIGMASPSNKEEIEKKLAYFTDNADKMRYGLFRAAGLFIGSGVVEAACKTIVGKRMKNAGMHWSKKNAEGVIALRCAIHSDEYGSVAA